jgi:hypothetical protein
MSKKKQIEVVVVSYSEYQDPEFVFPSKFMFRNELGQYVFIKTSKRAIAEQFVAETTNNLFKIREV